MSNVLSDEKRQQVIALGRLGWTLRRIEQATGVHRETASAYLRAAGIGVRAPGWWGRRATKPAIEVTTDFYREKPPFGADCEGSKPAIEPTIDPDGSKPAIGVTTDFCWEKPSSEATTVSDHSHPDIEPASGSATPKNRTPSACEPYREIIELGLDRGRNAMAIWQDLVTSYGFEKSYQSVKRYVQKIRPSQVVQPRAVIVTEPGEDYGEFRVMLRRLFAAWFPHRHIDSSSSCFP
jgi:hypothetical protein